jgi:hypothetical protein
MVVSGSDSEPDYAATEIATTKPPSEYSYVERRADLLQSVEDLGHPSLLNQTEEAERYDVSQQMVSKDLDRLEQYMRETQTRRATLEVEATLSRCVRGLLEDEDWSRAASVALDWHQRRREESLADLREEVEKLREEVDDLADGDAVTSSTTLDATDLRRRDGDGDTTDTDLDLDADRDGDDGRADASAESGRTTTESS